MDLSMYPNIAGIVNQLGGIKQTAFNKKRLASAEEEFARLPQDFLMQVNQEIPSGVKIMNNYITPSAILICELHTLRIIPTRDIIWIYTQITTMRMNFIPYSKQHSLFMLIRNGETINLGIATTGGFSKKLPLNEHLENIGKVSSQTCPGMLLGYTDEIAAAASNNFAGLVQSVDARNQGL